MIKNVRKEMCDVVFIMLLNLMYCIYIVRNFFYRYMDKVMLVFILYIID